MSGFFCVAKLENRAKIWFSFCDHSSIISTSKLLLDFVIIKGEGKANEKVIWEVL